MRTSMIYPNICFPDQPTTPTFQAPPDIGRLKIREDMNRYSEEDERSSRRSRSRRRDKSPRPPSRPTSSRPSSRAPSRPHSSRGNTVRFYDEHSPTRPRSSRRSYIVPDKPKSYIRDAPPVAINESAKETAKRLFREKKQYHRRDDSGCSTQSSSGGGLSPKLERNGGGLSPKLERNGGGFLKVERPGLRRAFYSEYAPRGREGEERTNFAVVMDEEGSEGGKRRQGHRRWHSKG